MSSSYIPSALRRRVIERAQSCCEYCKLSAQVAFFPHEVDHITAEKHGGQTTLDNLAYTCWRCNRHKGSDLGSFDPITGGFAFLFHPRQQSWTEHFQWQDLEILGKTPEGRVTIYLLQLNTAIRIQERSHG
jgi:hypothetical protein